MTVRQEIPPGYEVARYRSPVRDSTTPHLLVPQDRWYPFRETMCGVEYYEEDLTTNKTAGQVCAKCVKAAWNQVSQAS